MLNQIRLSLLEFLTVPPWPSATASSCSSAVHLTSSAPFILYSSAAEWGTGRSASFGNAGQQIEDEPLAHQHNPLSLTVLTVQYSAEQLRAQILTLHFKRPGIIWQQNTSRQPGASLLSALCPFSILIPQFHRGGSGNSYQPQRGQPINAEIV